MNKTGFLPHKALVKISNKYLVWFMLVMMATGLVLPGLDISLPSFLGIKPDQGDAQEIALLKARILVLHADEKQAGLTAGQLENVKQRRGAVEARLAAVQFPKDRPFQVLVPGRPKLPEGIKYNLPLKNQATVPHIFIPTMPDLSGLSTVQRKERFIQIMLPLILRISGEITEQRWAMRRAHLNGDIAQLNEFAITYRVSIDDKTSQQLVDELLVKIAPIPISIALAQAAVESGWGRSRFTLDGNALFGQWVWNDNEGIKAVNQSDQRASVRKFPDLLSSVRSYMLNLNSFYAYADFRAARDGYLKNEQSVFDLTNYLSVYAQAGEDYVMTLKKMIEQNDFIRFEGVKLKPVSQS